MESHYCFVDAGALRGYLDNISRRFHAGKVFEIDFTRWVSIFGFTKLFYYDALPVREQGETEIAYEARIADQKKVLNRASATNRVHVYEGDARRRRKVGLQQKKVDVMLAVDMLTHTFRGNMERATLITGDNDFKPLIDAVIHEGMYVQLMYPFGETSQELIDAADERYAITTGTLHSIMTDASRAEFNLPQSQTFLRGHEPPVTIEQTWQYDGIERELVTLHGYEGDPMYGIRWQYDGSNYLQYWHRNLAWLDFHIYQTQGLWRPARPGET